MFREQHEFQEALALGFDMLLLLQLVHVRELLLLLGRLSCVNHLRIRLLRLGLWLVGRLILAVWLLRRVRLGGGRPLTLRLARLRHGGSRSPLGRLGGGLRLLPWLLGRLRLSLRLRLWLGLRVLGVRLPSL